MPTGRGCGDNAKHVLGEISWAMLGQVVNVVGDPAQIASKKNETRSLESLRGKLDEGSRYKSKS